MANQEAGYNLALGIRIAAARKRKDGMTQARLAELLGIGRTSVVMMEMGKQRVHAYLLAQLSTELSVPIMDLLPPPGNEDGPTIRVLESQLQAPEVVRRWLIQGLGQADIVVERGGKQRGNTSSGQVGGGEVPHPSRRKPASTAR